jgi:hypothetical protein
LWVIRASIGDIQFSITRPDFIRFDRDDYSMPILARAFTGNWRKFPDRCYLQITGIYTFPDYLKGSTVVDFRPRDNINLSG